MRSVNENYRENVRDTFSGYKNLAEKAMAQVSDEEFFRTLCPESNSIAVIVKHIAGNLVSRFTDFLTTDGEKVDRDRDSEFIVDETSRERLMDRWEHGWNVLLTAVQDLDIEDFGNSVTIRGEPHSVIEALNRQLTHYAYHIGQIVYLAKHYRSSEWQTLSVPRNRSAEFNEFLKKKKSDGQSQSHPLVGPEEFSRRIE